MKFIFFILASGFGSLTLAQQLRTALVTPARAGVVSDADEKSFFGIIRAGFDFIPAGTSRTPAFILTTNFSGQVVQFVLPFRDAASEATLHTIAELSTLVLRDAQVVAILGAPPRSRFFPGWFQPSEMFQHLMGEPIIVEIREDQLGVILWEGSNDDGTLVFRRAVEVAQERVLNASWKRNVLPLVENPVKRHEWLEVQRNGPLSASALRQKFLSAGGPRNCSEF